MGTDTYSLLDFGNGTRHEQWGPYSLLRPDPTALGAPAFPENWAKADAVYKGEKGKGEWETKAPLPEHWSTEFDDLKLVTRLTPYKHTGVFPEQAQNWRQARAFAKKANRPLNILNLFAYTGGATVALAKDGHFVTHVDASKPAIAWAKENAALNQIAADRTRWILEDAPTFVSRELKRGKKYDGIILDPPAYGHGGAGKTWRMERDLAPLLENCCSLLSENPAFLILNGYAKNDTPDSFRRLLTGILLTKTKLKNFDIDQGELMLTSVDGRILSTGIVARCEFRQ